jgi:hypothetical protein
MNVGSRILDVFAKISDSLRRISLEKKNTKIHFKKEFIIGSSDSFTNLVFTNSPIFPQNFLPVWISTKHIFLRIQKNPPKYSFIFIQKSQNISRKTR